MDTTYGVRYVHYTDRPDESQDTYTICKILLMLIFFETEISKCSDLLTQIFAPVFAQSRVLDYAYRDC